MSGLVFQELIVISDIEKSANQFKFQKTLNLITGNNNSIGKSTLAKVLLWGIGCSPRFDSHWDRKEVKTIVRFSVSDDDYVVIRDENGITLINDGGEQVIYSKITGDYSEKFSEIVNFNLRLQSRDNELECPPPAFYFLPFYVDQEKSWGEPWGGFEKLAQYPRFTPTLIKYFCGYLKARHFDYEIEIIEYQDEIKLVGDYIVKLESSISLLDEIFDRKEVAVTKEQLEEIQGEITHDLHDLSIQQLNFFDKKLRVVNDIHALEGQHKIATRAAEELEEDYVFAVENIADDKLECPYCGVIHDNSLPSRASILIDKENLLKEASDIKLSILQKEQELEKIQALILNVEQGIDNINAKYILESSFQDEALQRGYESALGTLTKIKLEHDSSRVKNEKNDEIKKYKEEIKNLKSDQRKLTSAKEKRELNDFFKDNLSEIVQAVSAQGVDFENAKSPMDYKKILGGGAAEGVRGFLAYYFSVLRQIRHVDSCVLAPIILDTPNQQEQADDKYNEILKFIQNEASGEHQIIICGMENEALEEIKKEAKVITLNKSKLLSSKKYFELKGIYSELVSDSQGKGD